MFKQEDKEKYKSSIIQMELSVIVCRKCSAPKIEQKPVKLKIPKKKVCESKVVTGKSDWEEQV